MAKHPFQRAQRIIAASAFLIILPGCDGSGLSRAFGLERSMPDEYTVTTQPPLSMPPSADLNRPGEGGRKSVDSASIQALETLAPEMALQRGASEESAGQQDILKAAAQAAADPTSGTEMQGSGADLTDIVLFWKGHPENVVVDGDAENRRIRDASALGRSPATGTTKVKRASKGFLGLF